MHTKNAKVMGLHIYVVYFELDNHQKSSCIFQIQVLMQRSITHNKEVERSDRKQTNAKTQWITYLVNFYLKDIGNY